MYICVLPPLFSLEIWFETGPAHDGLSARSGLQKMTDMSEVHYRQASER